MKEKQRGKTTFLRNNSNFNVFLRGFSDFFRLLGCQKDQPPPHPQKRSKVLVSRAVSFRNIANRKSVTSVVSVESGAANRRDSVPGFDVNWMLL